MKAISDRRSLIRAHAKRRLGHIEAGQLGESDLLLEKVMILVDAAEEDSGI